MTGKGVTVFGAYGHTGRFIVDTLLQKGWTPIAAGRDAARLAAFVDIETRVASIDDPASLDRALRGARAVINCAGPFLDTASPLVEAALRARIDYLDVCAEQPTVLSVFERYDAAAKTAGIAVVPAMAFFGGLADLLATVAVGDWPAADRIEIAVALDSWHPTAGTRITGERNHGPRRVIAGGKFEWLTDPAPLRRWPFQAPFGEQEVVALPLSEIITISRHLRADTVNSYMTLAPLRDLRDPATPPPVASDARGRSSQRFLVEVVATRAGVERRTSAAGRDIYAITAPLIVAALERLVAKRGSLAGVLAPGAAFDARELLASIEDLDCRLAG